MNLLSNIFDIDRIKIMEVNRKYMIFLVTIVLFLTFGLFCIKKDYYYINTITNVGENIVLVVEKDMINNIKNKKRIIVDDIENDYSINKVEELQDVCFVYVNMDYKNIHDKMYKIYLGKENVLEYIIRILKK